MSAPALSTPIPSGARFARDCDRPECDGYRTWNTPAGPVNGHLRVLQGPRHRRGRLREPPRIEAAVMSITLTDLQAVAVQRPTLGDVAADVYTQLDDVHNALLAVRPGVHDRHDLPRALSAVRDAKDALYRVAMRR